MSGSSIVPIDKLATSARDQVLLTGGATLLASSRDHAGAEVADLLVFQGRERRSCFVLLCWRGERVVQAELFLTQAEAHACLAHGRALRLTDFDLPPVVTECL